MMEIQLYNQELADLRTLPDELDFDVPDKKPEDFVLKDAPEEPKTRIETGILERLNDCVNLSQEDYDKATNPKWTGKARQDNLIERDMENYFENSLS